MTTKRALVVGIDAYGKQYPLDGCVNDARAMVDVLQEKFGFPQENVTLLTDAAATKEAILRGLDDIVDATNRGDVALFYYAGHGSRLDAKISKASGFTTALCPVDVTTGGGNPYFLLDDELHERLLDLAERTSFITVIIDACHSGTVTRDLFGDKVRSMNAGPEAAEAYGSYVVPRRRPPRSAGDGAKGPSGWVSLSDNYVLIAGCRDEEVSNEFEAQSGEKHGVLTYFLTQELVRATSGTSYRDVFERVAANVTSRKPGQHPQMEGRVDRDIFGVSELLPMNFASVVERGGDRVVLNRGSAHGTTVGSTYKVFPQGTKRIPSGDVESANTPCLGTIQIESVAVVRSVARITAESSFGAIGLQARAFEISHARGTMSMAVEIDAPEGSEAAALRDALAPSPLLELSSAGSSTAPFARVYLIGPRESVGPSDPAPQFGAVDRPTWVVVDTTGQLLMARRSPGEEATIRANLEKVVRYRQALALDNPNPNSALRGKFTLEVLRWDATGNWVVATADEERGLPVIANGDPIAFRITGTHDKPTYISVLDFQENYALSLLFPVDGGQDMLNPGSPFEKGAVLPGSRERMKVQGSFNDGALEVTETLKLFVTSSPANFGVLAQAGTRAVAAPQAARSPLTTLLRMAVETTDRSESTNTRAIVGDELPEDDPDDWTTVTASFVIRRTPVALEGQSQTLNDRTTLQANGFSAVVSNSAGTNAAADALVDAVQRAVDETDGTTTKRIEVADARMTAGT
ncbi:MAG TPA: caspase family protein, partial [Gemmatimonadaceae bacterium]